MTNPEEHPYLSTITVYPDCPGSLETAWWGPQDPIEPFDETLTQVEPDPRVET
jgi:hypothetical protein